MTKYDIISRGGKTTILMKEDMMFLTGRVKKINNYES